MVMSYEGIKSAILTILVLGSIFLTWNLWTYQPHYETLDKTNTVAEVSLSEKQEVKKIVRPDQVVYHIKGEHYGTNNANELDRLIKELSSWSFSDVKNYSDKVGNIKELVHGSGNVEIIFPADIPIDLYRSVLTFQDKKIPAFNFSRIIINVENSEKETGSVYFVSSDYQQVYISHISASNIADFTSKFYKTASHYPRFFAYQTTDKKVIYLPDNNTEMMEYKYLPVTFNADEFKEALFSDPRFVQKSFIPSGEEFTNGISKMTVNNNTNMLIYVNPTAENSYFDTSYDLVKRSIDFVNEHGGWTDPYRYVGNNEVNKSVTFRLYSIDGYPVFNEDGISEMTEVWGRDEINKYVRPNIALELPLTSETQKMTLPSGHEALKFLQSKKDFKPELLDQLVLGYHMQRDSEEQRLILLEPAWYYRYDKAWGQITMDDLGGMKHGLE
jgi:regulatory protein YycH of two-component signal transduction system YycFG